MPFSSVDLLFASGVISLILGASAVWFYRYYSSVEWYEWNDWAGASVSLFMLCAVGCAVSLAFFLGTLATL